MNKLFKLCAFLLLVPSLNAFAVKVCEFNDPVSGTTPGCTQNGVGGGGGTIAYNVYKNGEFLVTVWRHTPTYNNPYQSCTMGVSTPDSDYYISYSLSNNCSNYRVYTDLVFGQVQPKYKVLTVVYAPPGTQGGGSASSVTYGSSSSIGSTSSASESFKSSYSVSVKASGGILGTGGSVSANFGSSRSSSSSEALEVKKTASAQISFSGPSVDGIDHDRDLIWLWLGPAVDMEMSPIAGEWTIDDAAVMDVQYVYVGHLKNPSLMPPGVVDRLEAYGITTDDYDDILQANPLADEFAPLNTDRYKQLNMTFPYEPPFSPNDPIPTLTFAATYSDTGTFSNTVTNEYSTGYSRSGSVGFTSLFDTSVETNNQWTWTDIDTRSNSSGTSESASVTIGGPSYGYTGPTDMRVYYDVIYKTFAFIPITSQQAALQGFLISRSEKDMSGKEVVATVDGVEYRTLTNANGEYRIYGDISTTTTTPQFRIDGITMKPEPALAMQTQSASTSEEMNFILP